MDSEGLSGTSDWKQVICDFTDNGKYLAVWLQGSGVVWVDDLSVRELAPPPAIRMSLAATDYSSAEAAAGAALNIGLPRLDGLTVALRLRAADGKEVYSGVEAVRKGSFKCRVPLGGLAPGAYELLAELKGADGKGIGEARDKFSLYDAREGW